MKRTGKMKLLALVLAVVLVFGMMPGSLTNAAAKTAETEVVEETSPADDETFVESETEDVTEDETETTAEDAAEPEAEDAGENAGATMEENPAADPEEETTAPEEESEPAEEDYGIQTLDVLQGVTYVDENGEVQTTTADVDVTELTSSTTTWNEGWYVVNRNVSISGTRVAVSGEVHLILADGCTLTVGRGIQVSGDNTLYIYGQTEGTGALSITSPSTYSAGIGSNGVTSGTDTTGTIIINGGVINAKGGSYGSGIGGGTCGSSGEITINGGTVTASGGNGNYQYGGGSGIGSGSKGSCGEITINGGTVTASGGNGSYGGSGIGSSYYGSGGTITINGGTVTAKGGSYSAGIGTGLVGEKITINITGGTINATGSSEGEAAGIGQGSAFKSSTYRDMGTINITGGTVYASAGWAAACIGTGEYTKGGTINISGGTVVTSSGHTGIGHGSGTSGNMTFTTGENGHAVIYTDDINVTGSKSSWSGLISSSSATGDALVYGSPEFTSEESIPSGKTVRIEAGKTLTVAEGDTFTNNGDLYLDYGYEGISDACINSDETTIYYEIVNNEIDVEGAEAHSDRVYAKSGDELSATSMEDGSELLEYTGEKQSGEPLEVKEDLSFTMPAEPVELKPVVREFTLQYNANGGDGEVPKNQTVLNNADNKYVTIASGKGLTKNEWKDPFAAWNTESDGSGTLYVEGDEFELNESTTLYAQYPHEHNYHDNDYSDGFCRCGFYEPADWDDTEERYEIGNLGQLYWFMSLVNGDASLAEFTTDDTNRGASANAALTADIGTIENPVEQNFTAYGGNFDGQGYTITLKLNGNTETALFATTNGASICNLYTAGTIEASGKYAAGIVGEVSGNFTMKCCISSVEINSSVNGDGTHGGLVANLTSGCPEFTVEDCAFTGSIIGDTTTKCGGIVGYKNGTPSGIIKNCWTTGTFELGSSDSDSETIVRNGPSNIENCYYLDPIRSGSTQGTQKDADEFASGEVTWLLNGGVVKEDGTIDQDATTDGSQAWYQNLSNGEDRDDTPVLEQHGTVYGGYAEDSCILCYSNSELSPEAVHSLGEGKAEVPATCEETGTKACYQCEACERYFEDADATKWLSEDDIIIPALGHDYDYEKATFKWTTADESGYTVTATAVCTRDEEHICDPIDCTVSSVVTKPGSCKEPGSITYTATLTVNGVTYASDEKTDELPIMGSVTAEDYSVTYDGEAHGIIVTVALNDDVPEGYTITYSEDEETENIQSFIRNTPLWELTRYIIK